MIIVITGPTASGKSKIAIDVAKHFNGVIINADAFQVYKELNIGTAKPSADELKIVPHYLYNYVSINTPFSIYQYQKDCRKLIDEFLKENKIIVLVGGSGLYIRSVLYDYTFKDNETLVDMSDLESLSDEMLHGELAKVDKASAEKIHPHNRKRVLRALYIYRAYNKNKTELENEQEHKLIYNDVFIYSVDIDRETLYENINKRVNLMINNGLEKEVSELLNSYSSSLIALKAIGYREFIDNKNLSINSIADLIKLDTRHYAKRQLTFIRYQFGNNVKYIKTANDIFDDVSKNKNQLYNRTSLLIGEDNCLKLKNAKVAVIGIGGVGATCAEALVRSGIGNLLLIDNGLVEESNLNRQILYTQSDLNKVKVEQAKERLLSINTKCNISVVNILVDTMNIPSLFSGKFDFVVDCIDSINAKSNLIKYLIDNKINFISSLGMGNRIDLTKLGITTLEKTHDDPLAKKLRGELRKLNVDLAKVKVVASNEIPLNKNKIISSMIFVPSSAGLLLANYVVSSLIDRQ